MTNPKISLAQLDVKAGRPKKNVKRMLEMIEEAKELGSDIIAFPEMAVGGYLVGDKWSNSAYIDNLLSFNAILLEASEGIILIYGNVFRLDHEKGEDGRQGLMNSAYVFEDKELKGIVHKTNLPNYRIFDDKRYFISSNEWTQNEPIKLNNGTEIGVEICEDMWDGDYYNTVTSRLVNLGSSLIINISCSPWTDGKNRARDRRVADICNTINLCSTMVPFLYVNACGVQNNGKNIVTFDGDSRAFTPNGYPLESPLDMFEEGLVHYNYSEINTRPIESYLSYDEKIKAKYKAIIRAYQGMDEMMEWKPNYIMGISGGIDSALTTTLAVHALGKDRVIGYNMPSEYNSEKTKDAAYDLAHTLGIDYGVLPIQNLVETNIRALKQGRDVKLSSLVEENMQAKIRGTSILSNLTAIHKGVMTNNGNKLEIATGYCTIYGDMNGLFCPIGDLTKAEVFEMCRYINDTFGETIPSSMIPDENFNFGLEGIAPSAELKEAQLDPMKFGYHDRMIEMLMSYKKYSAEDFMQWYLDNELCDKMNLPITLYEKYNLRDPEVFMQDLEWFVKSIQKAIFKRIQAPPIVMLSKSCYGYDHRESQFAWESSLLYDSLKSKILEIER